MATVAKLQIAPVKGLALVQPGSIELADFGVPNNRRFFLVGPDGRHRSGLAFGPLAAIVPAYDHEREVLALRFPDGTTYEGDACALGGRLDVPWGSRSVAARELHGPWAAAFTQYMGMPMRLVRAEAGQNLQSRPVSLISTASLDELEQASDLPGPLDDRRFRMLVTVEGVPAWEEEAWIGRDLALGDAVVSVELRTQRCATTTRDPATGLRDWDALRAVKDLRGMSAERTIDFGVYANVVRPGRVAVGDDVAPAA